MRNWKGVMIHLGTGTKTDVNVDEVKVCGIWATRIKRKISRKRKHEFFFRTKIRDLMQCEGNRDEQKPDKDDR